MMIPSMLSGFTASAVYGEHFVTGLFASRLINAEGGDGLLFGNAHQLLVQVIGIGAVLVYSAVVTALLLYAIKALMGLRVTQEDEELGVDTTAHGEVGYSL